MQIVLIIVFFLLVGVLYRAIKIIPEGSRMATFDLVDFKQLIGPGITFINPFGAGLYQIISVGDRAQLSDSEHVKIKTLQIPCQTEGKIEPGQMVRISGFSANTVLTVLDPDQTKTFICEKCGHENKIS